MLPSFEAMEIAINYFLVKTIVGHMIALTNITFSYQGIVTFAVIQLTLQSCGDVKVIKFAEFCFI